jgi:hypothetical protein
LFKEEKATTWKARRVAGILVQAENDRELMDKKKLSDQAVPAAHAKIPARREKTAIG